MRKAITLATLTRTLAMAARKIDPVYPGTAVARLEAVHQRVDHHVGQDLRYRAREAVHFQVGRAVHRHLDRPALQLGLQREQDLAHGLPHLKVGGM